MKKRNWTIVILLVICIGLFVSFWMFMNGRQDKESPQILIDQPEQILELSVKDDPQRILQGIRATDDRDGDVTASLIVESMGRVTPEHEVTVTVAAFDSSGNVAKAQRVIRYTDYEGPRFHLDRALIYTYGTAFDVLNDVYANDWVDGDIRHKIKTTQMDDETLTAEGDHSVRFRVSNSLGDTEDLTMPVEVVANDRYNAQLHLTDYLIYLPVGAEFDPQQYLEKVTYRGQNTTLLHRVPDAVEQTITGTVDTQTPGVYAVTYKLVNTGSDKWTAYSRLIVVVEG